jgi:hypothetical protein
MTDMYSKLSRYHPLPEVHVEDAQGRVEASTALRLPPPTPGIFHHAVEAGDRLDHLAYKFYRRSERWWRICDANPEHLSPLELLGKEPRVTARFPLEHDDDTGPAPWPELRRRLEIPGVHELWVEDRVTRLREGEEGTESVVERAAVVRYNRLQVTPDDLSDVMEDVGFAVGPHALLGRVGKEIVIPPRTEGG